jgi:biopolymer transport protein ExbD
MPRPVPEIPNASMADIAFLLLTFFLVTTTVANDKGLTLLLPPPPESLPENIDFKIQERNLFKIQINSFDALLVEGEPYSGNMRELTDLIKTFVQNNGVDPASSDSPDKAIVSFKTDRGTTHKKFVEVLDAAQRAYYEIYADKLGVPVEKWREIASDPEQKADYNKSREGVPMNISIAEPTKVGG